MKYSSGNVLQTNQTTVYPLPWSSLYLLQKKHKVHEENRQEQNTEINLTQSTKAGVTNLGSIGSVDNRKYGSKVAALRRTVMMWV